MSDIADCSNRIVAYWASHSPNISFVRKDEFQRLFQLAGMNQEGLSERDFSTAVSWAIYTTQQKKIYHKDPNGVITITGPLPTPLRSRGRKVSKKVSSTGETSPVEETSVETSPVEETSVETSPVEEKVETEDSAVEVPTGWDTAYPDTTVEVSPVEVSPVEEKIDTETSPVEVTVGKVTATFNARLDGNTVYISDGNTAHTFSKEVDTDGLSASESMVYKKAQDITAIAKAVLFVSIKNKEEAPMGCFGKTETRPSCALCPISLWCKSK